MINMQHVYPSREVPWKLMLHVYPNREVLEGTSLLHGITMQHKLMLHVYPTREVSKHVATLSLEGSVRDKLMLHVNPTRALPWRDKHAT